MYPIAVLAGGLASRMQPQTTSTPKAMLEVAGRPFIAHQLALFRERGLTDVVLCVGHLAEQIADFVGDGRAWSLRVRVSHDGDRLLGTGGALRKAAPLLGSRFFVIYGDSYLRCDFSAVGQAFDRSGRSGLMTVFRNRNRLGPSNVLVEQGRILRYDKVAPTPEMQHIDYGLGVLTADALAGYPNGAFDLSRVYQDLIARDDLAAFESPDRFFEIGSPAGRRETEALLAGGIGS